MVSIAFILFVIGIVVIVVALVTPALRVHLWAFALGVLLAFLGIALHVWAGV